MTSHRFARTSLGPASLLRHSSITLALGAAALAGSPFPIDRHATAKALGFDRPTANSLDSVSDRDFALETLAAASISAIDPTPSS